MEDRGEISTKTLNKWRAETPKGKKLPEKVKKAELAGFADELSKLSGDDQEKTALVDKTHVRGGTSITDDLDSFIGKLEPGDIILTKGSLGKKRFINKAIDSFQKLRGASDKAKEWTHSGIYLGDGRIRHSYVPIKGNSLGSESKVRDHSLKRFTAVGRDILALRPKRSKGERKKAVSRSADLKNRKFNIVNLVRAGVLPKKKSPDETQLDNVPNSIICTNLVGYAYPKVDFGEKSIETLMPSDIADNKSLRSIAAFSADPRYKTISEYVKALRVKLRSPR
jgi:hypothetical protein